MLKIIIVDDEKASINVFMDDFLLDNSEVDAKCFKDDPFQAIAYAERTKIDIAFLDVNMPKINGIDLAKKLLEINPRIKFVFISGYERNAEKLAEIFEDNFIGLFSKPYQEDELRDIMNKIFNERQRVVSIRCLDAFNLFVNGDAVRFDTKKSKELLALLVDADGGYVDTDYLVAMLFPEKTAEKGKLLFKDNLYRLRKTLNRYEIGEIIECNKSQYAFVGKDVKLDVKELSDVNAILPENYLIEYSWSSYKK